jgi:hypothetical protein
MPNKTPEHILDYNRKYRKRVKYHLKRDKKKQSEYVNKSQKKNRKRVTKYHKQWRETKKLEKELKELGIE